MRVIPEMVSGMCCLFLNFQSETDYDSATKRIGVPVGDGNGFRRQMVYFGCTGMWMRWKPESIFVFKRTLFPF